MDVRARRRHEASRKSTNISSFCTIKWSIPQRMVRPFHRGYLLLYRRPSLLATTLQHRHSSLSPCNRAIQSSVRIGWRFEKNRYQKCQTNHCCFNFQTFTFSVRKVEHEFDFNFNFKYPRPTTAATAVALDEQVVCIRKQNLQHPLLNGVTQVAQNCNSLPNPHFSPRPPSAPLTFLLRTYSFWFLNSERSLPVNDGLQVLAECERGPVVILYLPPKMCS